MTQDELKALIEDLRLNHEYCPKEVILQAADELEALAQPEQEPVAYLCENAVGHRYFRWKKPSSTYKPIALYTSPPQRTWVGLEKKDMPDGADPLFDDPKFIAGMVYAANKLMEKNT